MKFGLETTRYLLKTLGDPHTSFPSVHVAGTNGKGSTASMIASVLTAAGYRVGLYTSPHLVRLAERIRINGREIPEEEIVRRVERLRSDIEARKATYFEATTAVAFQYFADQQVDIAVVETGLGGRLDSTNLLTPLISIITSIDLEHTDMLGRTIPRIAREKGGIMKPGVPCLIGRVDAPARKVLESIARRKEAPLRYVPDRVCVTLKSQSLCGNIVDARSSEFSLPDLHCSLTGTFQKENIALSLYTLDMLKKSGFSRVTGRKVRRGLADVRRFSGLRCRCEVLSRRPLVIADVAHNPTAVASLVRTICLLGVDRVVTLFGVMRDKDVRGMVTALSGLRGRVVVTAPKTERALESDRIVEMFHEAGYPCVRARDVRHGASLALRLADRNAAVIVTGSHYLVGEFLQEFDHFNT